MESQIDTHKELIQFVSDHIHARPEDILMKFSKKELSFDLKFAVMQIACRNKAYKKISYYLSHPAFLFPDAISSEQASDERVANFHASLIGTGKKVVDLTTGLGIDAMTIARQGNNMTCVELDPIKADALAYNSNVLNIPKLEVVCKDCVDYLKSLTIFPDLFFIDPARRDASKNRTYALSDCLPDVTKLYRIIIESGSELYIKASPLLDISAIRNELEYINAIYVVSVKNECKEVLIHLKREISGKPLLHAVDLDDKGIKSSFSLTNEKDETSIPIAEVQDIVAEFYLYEPNSALMKLNAAREICRRFTDIKKISANTELYVSPSLIADFPGRIIKIERIPTSKELKHLKGRGFSVVSRNYPAKAEEIRTKFGLKENPDNFIYAFRIGRKGKPMIIEGKRMDAHN